MIGLLKTFGKGFLYVLGLPFFLVALALFGVLGLCAFIFQLIKSVIFFFTGHKFFPELKEDKELRLLKEGNNHPQEDVNSQPVSPSNDIITPLPQENNVERTAAEETINPTPVFVHKDNIEKACFTDDQPLNNLLKEEEEVLPNVELDDVPFEEETPAPVEETPLEAKEEKPTVAIFEEEPKQEETILETSEKKNDNEDELVEQLETYVPKSSTYNEIDDEDDEGDTDSGVNIDYDL